MRWLALVALAGCAGGGAAPGTLVASSARLPPPQPADPGARGAAYLTEVAGHLAPRWSAFLEDCRLRLPARHPLNATQLAATIEIAVGRGGEIVDRRPRGSSGNGDFDTAIADVLADASPLPAPPPELMSDDDLVHLEWLFARDRRQAGPATARVVSIELPLAAVIDGQLGRGDLSRAARRLAAAPDGADAAARAVLVRRTMIAALAEAVTGPDSAGRRTAVEACGRARINELAGAVRARISASDPELRLAAIDASAALADRAAAGPLLAFLRDDLVHAPRAALARISALIAIGRTADATTIVRAALDAGPNPTALLALAALHRSSAALRTGGTAGAAGATGGGRPVDAAGGIEPRLVAWAAARDAATRAAVCAALPGASLANAPALILRGLRDADATVRATCAEAAGRGGGDPAALRRLREIARDRDRSVRARAVAAISVLDPSHPVRAADDPAPEVRAAYAAAATPDELAALAADPSAEVRAAALITLGERAGDAALRAVADPSAIVRRAAVRGLADPTALARLAGDDSPDVATAALIRVTALRGRTAETAALLHRLADAPPASPERARIALAWLLAS